MLMIDVGDEMLSTDFAAPKMSPGSYFFSQGNMNFGSIVPS